MKNSRAKWIFAFILTLPLLLLYVVHFTYHDQAQKPTGLIQWEHAIYLISAKEYQTGNAYLLYQYPLDEDENSPKVFFQPQVFIIGYLWKWLDMDPGLLLTIFGLAFSVLTFRVAIEIIDLVAPGHKKLISILFSWGGGLLCLCGLILHFTWFKNTGSLPDHLFVLDPGNGAWCLNFGRALMYPLEAYYHFLFLLAILCLLRKQFVWASIMIVLLSLSHPYTSTELVLIVFTWMITEYVYVRSTLLKRKDALILSVAVLFHLLYYSALLRMFPVYNTISKHTAFDWSYKAWNFVPAYILVWFLSFVAVRNVSLLQQQFSQPHNRMFFCWGLMAFLLSVHGFAVRPVQPLHFTRGYVFAGFFLFAIPAILVIKAWAVEWKSLFKKIAAAVLILIFLSDNLFWFSSALSYNQTGTYINAEQQELIGFFQKKNENGWVISARGHEDLTALIQLYSPFKGWIPHPFLTFNIDSRKRAVDQFLSSEMTDEHWKKGSCYLFIEKDEPDYKGFTSHYPVAFENSKYKVFQLN